VSEGDPAAVAVLPPWLRATARAALARRSRWPQALLVGGPEGIGKRALALHLARALLCEAPSPDGGACGTCASCGYVAAMQHPDLRIVEPVDVDEEGTRTPTELIRVEAVRELTRWSQRTSHRGGAKVALIVPAERMHPPTANALLKTLEEPPAGTHLMLVAHQPDRLLPTIASRCQRLALPLPTQEVATAWLREQQVANVERVLAQAGGAPYRALELADESLQAERSAWLAALARPDTLSPLALAARIELGDRAARRDRLAAAIDWLVAWTFDLARVAAGGVPVRNPDQAGAIAALAPRVAGIPLFRYHRRLLEQRTLVGHPLQPRLVAEALLIDYRALF
jgi:DNA polymerase-3 subunit delta'